VLLPTVTGTWFVSLFLHCESVVTDSWRTHPNSAHTRKLESSPLFDSVQARDVLLGLHGILPQNPNFVSLAL
jgi:hypothetical protein